MDERVRSLSPADETLVARYSDSVPATARIILSYADTDAGEQMAAFCERLHALIPALTLVRESADGDPPSIHVSSNIHFQAVPTGKLLELFLFALLGNDAIAGQDLGVEAGAVNERIILPATLKMYVSPNCPYCPQALPRGLFLAGAAPSRINLLVIDAQLFSEQAKTDRVRSVPVTILDDHFRWTGVFDLDEVISVIVDRDPTQLGADTLKKMISDGNAEGVARLMDEANIVIPGFIDLLTQEKWSARLGAMVAFEYLSETNAGVSVKIIDQLWDRFTGLGDAVQGDILHLFGVLDDPGQLPRLEEVKDGPFPETIREVAREVIAAIK